MTLRLVVGIVTMVPPHVFGAKLAARIVRGRTVNVVADTISETRGGGALTDAPRPVAEVLADNDYCLQKAPHWGVTDTCRSNTNYCDSFAKDMQRCCPYTCGTDELTEEECHASDAFGTCVYPRPQLPPFYFTKYSTGKYCYGSGGLWGGYADRGVDCELRCSTMERCVFYTTYSNNWCELRLSCPSERHATTVTFRRVTTPTLSTSPTSSPIEDNDYCLQQTPYWRWYDTCQWNADWCLDFAKDMQRCCPYTCGTDELTEAECHASDALGTCIYPRPGANTYNYTQHSIGKHCNVRELNYAGYADGVECELRCSRTATCAFYTKYSGNRCRLMASCPSERNAAFTTAETFRKVFTLPTSSPTEVPTPTPSTSPTSSPTEAPH